MPPKGKKQTSLLGLVDSDEEDLLGLAVEFKQEKPTKATKATKATKTMAPAKKATRGRAAANKVTKATKPSTRRSSDSVAEAVDDAPAKPPSGAGRGRRAKPTPEVIPDSQPEPAPPPKRAPRGRKKAVKEPTPEPEREPEEEEREVEEEEPEEEPLPPPRKRGRPAKKVPETIEEIPETQVPVDDTVEDMMDIDVPEETTMEQIEALPTLPPPRNQSLLGARQTSPARFSVSKRPTSVLEHGTATSDPTLRRRLGELTQKYDSLELRYRDLREIGVKEAERNFDKLKKQSEERANTANQLIASFKAELATQTALANEGNRVKTQLDESDSKIGDLQHKVEELTTSLSDARSEIKLLNTKLAASRSAAEAAATGTRHIPGSALKNGLSAMRQAASNDAAQLGQAKGELYCDLTGLIITGVKRDGDDDVFDCIQTGRNGTLHFKLVIANEMSSDAYEDVAFVYKPQLDANRDKALIEMLPEYLADQITFPRPQASKFYARVMKALTEKPEE